MSWNEAQIILRTKVRAVQILANLAGALSCIAYFTFIDPVRPLYQDLSSQLAFPMAMLVIQFSLGWIAGKTWQRDILDYIQYKIERRDIPEKLAHRAGRKILNIPFVFSLMSLLNWMFAAIVMPVYFLFFSKTHLDVANVTFEFIWMFIGIFLSGIVVCVIIFFFTENLCRKTWPLFFPQGGLEKVTGIFRPTLGRRIFLTVFLASVLPLLDLAVLAYDKAEKMLVMNPQDVLDSLFFLIVFILFVEISVAFILSRQLTRNVVEPINDLKHAMVRVREGDLSASAKVMDTGELGVLADSFNHMTVGLRERWQMQRSLALARDVQQNLLPEKPPHLEGLDIAASVLYCDETGGDYYDFLQIGDKPAFVIGDVSDHGIPSALLMATVRAFLRQRAALPGSIADLVTDINGQFVTDTMDSGSFMTLFLLTINTTNYSLEWVRAGHDPALIYDPVDNRFHELMGKGISLGTNPAWQYTAYREENTRPGQIILLATDGLWETRNPAGDMFGKKAIRKIIQNHAELSSQGIQDALMGELHRFAGSARPDDDITMVVIKINSNGKPVAA